MQQVILFTGLAGVLGGLGIVASRWTFEGASIFKRMVLGVIPGIGGALIVGVWQLDLMPNQMEAFLLPFLLGIGSFAIGTLVVLELRAR